MPGNKWKAGFSSWFTMQADHRYTALIFLFLKKKHAYVHIFTSYKT